MKTKHELMAPYAHGKILDIGYAQTPNEVLSGLYGVDIVPIKHKNYKVVKMADFNTEPLPFGNAQFDTVLMGCVLAHVHNPLKLLSEINRVLKKDGTLVLTSPNPQYYWEVILNVFYHWSKKRVCHSKHTEHLCSFSRYEMRSLLGRAGFLVEKELGSVFALVKTPLRFNPCAGFAYEIVYVSKKIAKPKSFVVFNSKGKSVNIDTVI